MQIMPESSFIRRAPSAYPNHGIPSPVTLERLLSHCELYITSEKHRRRIADAYTLAAQAHTGMVRKSGEPYIQHPLEVAFLLADMRIDADGIIAALLHDVVEDTDYTLEDLREAFGSSVATIVDGVTKFKAIARKQQGEKNIESPEAKRRFYAETVRKLLVAMAEEPRVVALKIADRVHNMRTLGATSAAHQRKTSLETREMYIPLARRLGMAQALAELEDLALYYLEPEVYHSLRQEVEAEVQRRLPFLEEVREALRAELQRAGLRAEAYVWQKHMASIKRKREQAPFLPLSQMHDLVSFRVLVETDRDCYQALGRIHGLWRAKDGRIKDYIATPKLNGYQSLHTAVFAFAKSLVEFQIRTPDMQRTADYGLASYWYLQERLRRTGEESASTTSWWLSYREMASWIAQLRQWQRELPQDTDAFVEAFKADSLHEQIFVSTPKGEVRDLPCGSTPLDMAYRIHADLGNHCAGARVTTVNEHGLLTTRQVPLDYQLKDGEIVEIQVDKSVHPTHEWLVFARTTAARTEIERALKRISSMTRLFPERSMSDLVMGALQADTQASDAHAFPPVPQEKPYLLAPCCIPLPGDPIVVLFQAEQQATLHQKSCKQVTNQQARSEAQFADVAWDDLHATSYLVPVTIIAEDRTGLLRDVSAVVAAHGLNMTSVTSTASQRDAIVTVTLQFLRSERFLEDLRQLLAQFQRIKGVREAKLGTLFVSP